MAAVCLIALAVVLAVQAATTAFQVVVCAVSQIVEIVVVDAVFQVVANVVVFQAVLTAVAVVFQVVENAVVLVEHAVEPWPALVAARRKTPLKWI